MLRGRGEKPEAWKQRLPNEVAKPGTEPQELKPKFKKDLALRTILLPQNNLGLRSKKESSPCVRYNASLSEESLRGKEP